MTAGQKQVRKSAEIEELHGKFKKRKQKETCKWSSEIKEEASTVSVSLTSVATETTVNMGSH